MHGMVNVNQSQVFRKDGYPANLIYRDERRLKPQDEGLEVKTET